MAEEKVDPWFLFDKLLRDFYQYSMDSLDSISQIANAGLLANNGKKVDAVDFQKMVSTFSQQTYKTAFPKTSGWFENISSSHEFKYIEAINNRTKEAVISKIHDISQKGFISIPEDMFRKDDGIVGQILEREFHVEENNLHIADLGTYELKGIRIKKRKTNKLTLFHQTSTSGIVPLEIFERFCYEKPSKRDGSMKRKLFTTIKGNRENNLGFILKSQGSHAVDLYFHDEYLATCDLASGENKIKQILLVLAETEGKANSKDERFHYKHAYILSNPKSIYESITAGAVVLEFCIDQPIDKSKAPHDRGPHIRIPVKKLNTLFETVE